MMKKILFIYNPNSGKGKIKRQVDNIVQLFEQNDCSTIVYETQGPLDAARKVQQEAENFDLLVCGGGDGTLSEVVSGMMDVKNRVPIGFLPVGSTNDTRVGFKLPKNILQAADVCIHGTEFPTDVGKFNDDYFVYVASLGSLSAVSCFTPQEMKRILGHGAYLIEGIKQLLKMESYEMTVEFDDQVLTGNFFLGMVTNAVSVGGFEGITGKNVDLQDGMFEVALLKKPADLIEFNREIDLMLIHNKEDRQILDDVVVKFRTNKVIFKSDTPVQWVRDGENGGKHKTAVIEVCNKAVTIMSNADGQE